MPVLGGISGLDGLMIATGHFRNGILLAPLTAQLLASKIVDGSDSRFLSAFAPERRAAGSTVGN
jgi:glycine oxidase